MTTERHSTFSDVTTILGSLSFFVDYCTSGSKIFFSSIRKNTNTETNDAPT